MLCPKCQTGHAHRSRRAGAADQLAGLVAYYPYRCRKCSHRFRKFSITPSQVTAPVTAAEREVFITQSASLWKQRRREIWLYCFALTLFVVLLYFLTRVPSGE
jgi:hypothetical protein